METNKLIDILKCLGWKPGFTVSLTNKRKAVGMSIMYPRAPQAESLEFSSLMSVVTALAHLSWQ